MLTKVDILTITLLFTHLKPEQQPEYFDIPPPGIHKDQFSEIDWAFYTETQENCGFATVKQRDLWIQGKVLGGGSVLNYMIYNRGNRRDYDNWAKGGATGWSYDEVLPYFKKSEDNTNRSLAEEGYHGYGGELTVSSTKFQTPALHAFPQSWQGAWLRGQRPQRSSTNGFHGQPVHCSGQRAVVHGKGLCAAHLWKEGAQESPRVTILHVSPAVQILFEGKRAVAVTFKKDQRKHTVRATKEIIISAGVINSPKLLMLSGVGPRKHLEEMKIPVVADLPVGENLQDHALAAGSLVHLNESLGEGFTGVRGAIEYYRHNTGKYPTWAVQGT
ncbi:hypothetical protein MRX96_002939 [Rhipicephalus microplus]